LVDDAPEIASAIPTLGISAGVIGDNLPPANARFRLFDGFSRFIAQVCHDRTLVILLDDIHRADIDSLMLLEFLYDALRSARLLVVSAHRPGELRRSNERFDALARTTRRVPGVSIPLSGLGARDISRLVRARGGWSPTIEQVREFEELTGGNPFFLGQLTSILKRDGDSVEQAAAQLPATARDAIGQQLQGIGAEALSLLRTASVIGREFEGRIIARAHRLTITQVAAALGEAVEAGVVLAVAGETDTFRFMHALVREVLYQSLSSEERARLHDAVGQALEDHSIARTARLAEIAVHYSEAAHLGNVDRAIEACSAAAEAARKAVAYADAVKHYERALEVLETHKPSEEGRICSLLLSIGGDQVRGGDRDGAKKSFDRAARIAEAISAPRAIAEAALGVAPGFFSVEAGVHDELLIGMLRRARVQLGDNHDPLRALVLARLGMALFWSDSDGQCAALSREAWKIVRAIDDRRLRLQVLMARWLAEWTPYEVDERCTIANEAIALARAVGDKEVLAVAIVFGLVGLFERGRLEQFDERAHEFRGLAEEIRQPQALWYSALIKSARDLYAGRFVRAEEAALNYFEIGRRIGDANAFHSRMAQGLIHAAEQGDWAAILAISEEARQRYPIFVGWRATRCWALARLGDFQAAEAGLDELVAEGLSRLPRKLDWPTTLVVLAETASLLRRGDVAEELYELLLPLRGRLLVLGFCVMSWGPVTRYLGLLCESLGRLGEAAGWYEEAIGEARRSGGEPWVAHSCFGLFRVRAATSSDPKACAELAQAALRTAQRLGMRHLAGSLQQILGSL